MTGIGSTVTVQANGKVNLALHVSPRGADGYHDIETVFMSVGLSDTITCTSIGDGRIEVEVSGEGAHLVPADGTDLAGRAARLLRDRFGDPGLGVHLQIDKAIPVAGGMAGGSADAAAVLRGCNELWHLAVSESDRAKLAAELGADVPFAQMGGVALGMGRGDDLMRLPCRGKYHWVLALAHEGLSTAAVYDAFDQLPAPASGPSTTELADALLAGDIADVAAALVNDLQPAAIKLRPELGETLAAGAAMRGVLGAVLAGSGPTCAFLCESAEAADRVAVRLQLLPQVASTRVASGPAGGATTLNYNWVMSHPQDPPQAEPAETVPDNSVENSVENDATPAVTTELDDAPTLVEAEAVEDEAVEGEAVEDGTPQDDTSGDETTEDDVPEEETPADDTPEEAPEADTPVEETPADAPSDAVAADQTPEEALDAETATDELVDDAPEEAPKAVAAEETTPGDDAPKETTPADDTSESETPEVKDETVKGESKTTKAAKAVIKPKVKKDAKAVGKPKAVKNTKDTKDPKDDEDVKGGGFVKWFRHHRAGKIVLIVMLAFLLVAGSTVGVLYAKLNSRITQEYIDPMLGSERPTIQAPTSTVTSPVDPFTGRALNIVVIGSDSRGDADPGMGQRSDTTFIAHISADRTRVDLVSIPRDTLVTIPNCVYSDGSTVPGSGARNQKFNAAFSFGSLGSKGNSASGAACTIKLIEALSGVRIDGFVVIDFAGFKQIIDAIGGVDIFLPCDVVSGEDWLSLPAGPNHLAGVMALRYARARIGQGLGDGSDLMRIQRQQVLFKAIAMKALSMNYLTNLTTLYDFAGSLADAITTNLGSALDLAGLAYSLRGIDTESITFNTIPIKAAKDHVNVEIVPDQVGPFWWALAGDTPVADIAPPKTPPPNRIDGLPTPPPGMVSAPPWQCGW